MSKIEQYYNKLQTNKQRISEIEMENEAIKNYMVILAKESINNYIFISDISKILADKSETDKQ